MPSSDHNAKPDGCLDFLYRLCDPGSLSVIRSRVRPRGRVPATKPGDGVVGALGEVDGRPVVCYAQDPTFLGGSLGEAHAETIRTGLEIAREARIPVLACIASAGARLQEGVAALASYGRIFRQHVSLRGNVPQISIMRGTCAGGGAYAPALTDFVLMTRGSSMFLTGPKVIEEVTGERVTMDELGGIRVHERNGVCHLTAGGDEEAIAKVRQLLGYLPQNSSELPPPAPVKDPPGVSPADVVPEESRRVYDMQELLRSVSDGGEILPVAPRWGPNMVCAFARIGGRSIGFVANQPKHLGGTLDAAGSDKAAWFVRICDSFGIPLVVMVDTPGFLPGTAQERAAVIRHGASLIDAFAGASVPRLTVVVRKAYGGAYIAMSSKSLGGHLTMAWPSAEIGVMGPRQAVRVMHRRELAAAPDPGALEDELSARYAEEHLRAEEVAADGFLDEIVAPEDTRAWLESSLRIMASRRRRSDDAGWRDHFQSLLDSAQLGLDVPAGL